MTMTATARPVGDGITHEVDVNARHSIVTDEPEGLGGADLGPAPHELLAATLASCIATMIAMYARNHGWDLSDSCVEVEYDADSTPRRFSIEIRLPADLPEERRRRLERVARTCPVRRALEAGFSFQEELVSSQSGEPCGTHESRARARNGLVDPV
jgi:putative redox protein